MEIGVFVGDHGPFRVVTGLWERGSDAIAPGEFLKTQGSRVKVND